MKIFNDKYVYKLFIIVLSILTFCIVMLFYGYKTKTKHYKYNDSLDTVIENLKELNYSNTSPNTAYSQIAINKTYKIAEQNNTTDESIFIDTDTGYKNYIESFNCIDTPYTYTIRVGESLDVANDKDIIQGYLQSAYNVLLPSVALDYKQDNYIISLCYYRNNLDYSYCYFDRESNKLNLTTKGYIDKYNNIRLRFKDNNYLILYSDYNNTDFENKSDMNINISLEPYSWLCYGQDSKYKDIYDIVNLVITDEDYKLSYTKSTQEFMNINYNNYKYIELYTNKDIPVLGIKGE